MEISDFIPNSGIIFIRPIRSEERVDPRTNGMSHVAIEYCGTDTGVDGEYRKYYRSLNIAFASSTMLFGRMPQHAH